MDPYKQYGYSEGCSSSESGWTTYIASPMEEDGSDEHGDAAAAAAAAYANGGYCSGNYRDIIAANVGEADSDDSMASDASSGPCYHQSNGQNARHQGNLKQQHHEKGRKSISSSFSQFLSGIKSNSSKDKKKSEADRKLPAGGSRKRWK